MNFKLSFGKAFLTFSFIILCSSKSSGFSLQQLSNWFKPSPWVARGSLNGIMHSSLSFINWEWIFSPGTKLFSSPLVFYCVSSIPQLWKPTSEFSYEPSLRNLTSTEQVCQDADKNLKVSRPNGSLQRFYFFPLTSLLLFLAAHA